MIHFIKQFLISRVLRFIATSKKQKGAIMVEYSLLLITCVAMALLLAELVQVGNTRDSHGFIIKIWVDILQFIGETQ